MTKRLASRYQDPVTLVDICCVVSSKGYTGPLFSFVCASMRASNRSVIVTQAPFSKYLLIRGKGRLRHSKTEGG